MGCRPRIPIDCFDIYNVLSTAEAEAEAAAVLATAVVQHIANDPLSSRTVDRIEVVTKVVVLRPV